MSATTSRLVGTFDRWVDSGPFTPRDLGLFRIVFAVLMLVRIPRFRIIDAYPDSLYHPPPGPFMLFTGFPPPGTMVGVEIVLSVALAALAIGYRTRLASVAVTLLMLYGYGLFYSLGKIDHTIFLVILPGILLFTRWGDAFSVDAVLRRRRAVTSEDGSPPPTPQWPMRLLATLIGLGFLTAAIPKIAYGWLDPRTQAVLGVVNKEYYVNGRTDLLAPYALAMDNRFLWELGDLFAVGIEVAFILCAIRWRSFRTVLAAAALFHLGVLLTMNIFFVGNVVVYGAFVSWSALLPRRTTDRTEGGRHHGLHRAVTRTAPAVLEIAALLLAVVAGVGVWVLRQGVSLPQTSWPILVTGALVSAWYLLRQAVWLLRRATGGRSGPVVDLRQPGPSPTAGPARVQEATRSTSVPGS